MTADRSRQLAVSERQDCLLAQKEARRFALSLGFSENHSEEIVLVAAELASNLVKHAGKGVLTFRALEGEGAGIEIESVDEGPGIVDVDQSLADGYSTVGGLGYGLGSVNRLMDELDISSTPGLGTCVRCRRKVRQPSRSSHPQPWDVGAATRSRRFAPENGDAYIVKESAGFLLAGVIDGLGHGEPAQKAASAAQQYVMQHYDLALEKIFTGVNRACRGTRGVVMELARFHLDLEVSFSSLGNTEARAWGGDKVSFNIKRGILGAGPGEVTVQRIPWGEKRILALHSDGLTTHWGWADFPGFEHDSAQALARRLLVKLATDEDDATVVVIKT